MGSRVLLVLATSVLSVAVLCAQVNTSQINGVVKDASGAVIPSASITLTNPATGASRSTKTNETGAFVLPLLTPGTYDLKVEAQGFTSAEQKGILLIVGQQVPMNFTLTPGQVTTVVNVTEEQPLVEETRTEIGGSVSPIEVRNLPIIDRNFAELTLVVPGVRPAESFDPTKSRVGNMSVNGGDGRQFDISVDGADDKDNVVGGLLQNFTIEGIQEFNVITDHYSAESGRTVGGVVNVVTKSGTNTFHGTAFGLSQNSSLNKIDYFTAKQGSPKPVFHRYHFGGSAGGKVIKDKLFFFAAYEHKREPGSISVEPAAYQELSLFPLAQPITKLPFTYKDHLLTVKVDQHISDRQSISYRYGRERWENPNDQLGTPFVTDSSQTTQNKNQFHDFNAQHTITLSPSKVNSFSVHFQDFVNAISANPERTFTVPVAGGATATNPEIVFPSNAEIGQNVNVPQQTLERKYQFRDDFNWVHGRHTMKFGANYVYLAKLGGYFYFGANGYQVFFWDDPSTIVSDKAHYPQGFGTPGAVREIDFNGGNGSFGQQPSALGLYYQDDFKATRRLTLNLGLRWDGNIGFLPQQLADSPLNTNRTIAAMLQAVAANPTAAAAQQGLARMQAIVGNTSDLRRTNANWKEFQPRVGFAWDPRGSGRLVIRGGYGISYDQVFQNLTLFSLQETNPTLYQTVIAQTSSLGPRDAGGPAGQLAGFRFGVDPLPAPAAGLTDLQFGGFGRINDPRMKDPYSQQFSIGWAWQLANNYAVSADYYHVLGLFEPRVLNINPLISELCGDPKVWPGANPSDPRCVRGDSTRYFDAAFAAAGIGAGRLEQTNMIGTNNRSRSDNINVQLKKRFSRSFLFQVNYTAAWSNSWGGRPMSSYSTNSIAITPDAQFAPGEYGPTIFDERHRLVASGHFEFRHGIEVTPLFQAASARPYTLRSGVDTNGDGRTNLDRACTGSTMSNPLIPGVNAPFLCQQVSVNTLRGNPFAQMDLRLAKAFKTHSERFQVRLYWEFFNLFNRNNFGNNYQENASASNFAQPLGYFGGNKNYGPAYAGPLRSQFGFRCEW